MKPWPSVFLGTAVAMTLLWTGCATNSHSLLLWDGSQIAERKLSAVLQSNPLGPLQNIRVTLLQETERSSIHVVQVRKGEIPHVHQEHDLSVFVARGNGEMVIGSDTKTVHAGDVIHVPAGTRHYFTNTSPSPSVAVVVFSPRFDGKDTVPVQ